MSESPNLKSEILLFLVIRASLIRKGCDNTSFMMLDEGEETKEVGGKEHFQVLLET
jgi:hypothetical protein